MKRQRCTPATCQRGSSLIEVLVAVLVLAIGLLGIAAMQALTLKNTQSASERTAAIIQNYAILDMMRANRDAALAGQYNEGYRCAAPSDTSSRVGADRALWIQQLKQSVGESACARVECNANRCVVGVRWDDERATGGAAQQVIETQTRL
ncbi:type IV pilus modification protein PilV [Pseudoxanthomonas suwonensis]|jgi:type IV pilus modification protein PilV|uniref:type IV pilus modification protein PilV n=1 Tax=Pseudoxanthomonas suwonensis TaxID=314722 RepID=UPI0006872CFA|nr:type IV pilus modification protein PilV [Pseudoxanthomonas suwonensis]